MSEKLTPTNLRHLRHWQHNNNNPTRQMTGHIHADTRKLLDMGLIAPCKVAITLDTYRLTSAGVAALREAGNDQ